MESLLYFLLWAGLFFVLMRFGCGAHIMGHQHEQSDGRGKGAQHPKDVGPPESDVDPVCGKSVQTDRAGSALPDGTVTCFCSTDCRERFAASPAACGAGNHVKKPQGDSK